MMRKIWGLLAGCLLLAGCAGAPAASTAETAAATTETAATATPEQVAAVKTQRLTVVLNGCIAYEVDSAGGSLKTAIAAADLVVFLAGDSVPEDLAGETQVWQDALSSDDQATMDANWPGVYTCAQGICEDPSAQQGLLDDAGVTADFAAMDLTEVPDQLDAMNEVLTD
ncbi:hypothetical protein [Subdoligranulum variabile]|uniref:Flavodoxin-like domain-containing protein n=1 Tax=Subdoligranulum variabile DSM 15176 TaxID=411471 RepID=D1PQI2_9FIRM|nr:hypothetical protein [Subdoligranulum variabile]EFB75040.1 hypothetical protein SUBVAR_06651 [Subdoligranulum variabile DSM 15176]UWP69686.1 hypothetical protein NQ490_07505 [Subdoligranulum variabile]